jgi:hypothetical protein
MTSSHAHFTAPEALIRELLVWVAARPRTYRETMEAWRTSCPRLPVWEDATDGGLVALLAAEGGLREMRVELTPPGLAFLNGGPDLARGRKVKDDDM